MPILVAKCCHISLADIEVSKPATSTRSMGDKAVGIFNPVFYSACFFCRFRADMLHDICYLYIFVFWGKT